MALAVYRESFSSFEPVVAQLPDDITLDQMIRRMPALPEDFRQHGVICVDGQEVPAVIWPMTRPKPGITEVTFHYAPRGGGRGVKRVFAIIATIAIALTTGFIMSGGLLTSGGLFAAGSTSAYLLAAGVSLAGSLLMSALIPPPSLDINEGAGRQDSPGNASAQGNMLSPNGAIPRVVGERKVFPPLGCEPFTYFDGPDEVVEAVYVLAGPHRIGNIRIGATPAADMTGVVVETREGWEGDPLISLATRQTRTEPVQSELRGHITDGENQRDLETMPDGGLHMSIPQPVSVSTRMRPDEQQLQFVFPQGLAETKDDPENTIAVIVPIRIRMRPPGGAWINLPEFLFRGKKLGQLRGTIRLRWIDPSIPEPDPPGFANVQSTKEGWVAAYYSHAGQSQAPASSGWQAHESFHDGDGATYMTPGDELSSGLVGVRLGRYETSVKLDPSLSIWQADRYEIEVTRGATVKAGQFNIGNYQYDGSVWDLFGYRGTSPAKIPHSREGLVDMAYLVRSVSIWNEHPLPSRDLAVVAVRARNKQLDRISCVAGGWVKDWDGNGWLHWQVTDNPAPHLRDIFTGRDNLDPVPTEVLDDFSFEEFRQFCIDEGLGVNAIIEDQSVNDAARIVASCGYGRPYMADVWGVIWDRDTSGESPTQIFTPRNMANFQWTKAFARAPEGFRVNFPDRSRDYEQHQISVFYRGHSDDSGRVEQITYEGLVDESDVIRRANYDQEQARHRSTFYSWEAGAESILCRRGDLVGVQHDMLTRHTGAARIVRIDRDNAGDIERLHIDSFLPVADYHFMDESPDLSAEPDLSLLGVQTGVAIPRVKEESAIPKVSVHRATGGKFHLDFDPAIPDDGVNPGGLVAAGPLGKEFIRVKIFSIEPRPDYQAAITAVDEAPEIWEHI